MHVHLGVDSASGERETLGAGGGDSTVWTREARREAADRELSEEL
jgi:hypothetical protein